MSKHIFTLVIATTLLAGCGNGNNQNTTAYPYTVGGGGINGHPMCPPQVIQHWNSWVAPACNPSTGGPGNGVCNQALMAMMSNDAGYLQGPGCGVPVAQASWCPGNFGQQAYFDINVEILQGYQTQFGGPASFPAHR